MTTFTHTAVAASIVSAYNAAAKAEVKIVAAIAAATHGRDPKSAKSEAKAIMAKAVESLASTDERELRRLVTAGVELADRVPAPQDGATLAEAISGIVEWLSSLGISRAYHVRLWRGNAYAVGADGLAELGKPEKKTDCEQVEAAKVSPVTKLAEQAAKLEEAAPGTAAAELFRLFIDAATADELQAAFEAIPSAIQAKHAAAEAAAEQTRAKAAAEQAKAARKAELMAQLAELEA